MDDISKSMMGLPPEWKPIKEQMVAQLAQYNAPIEDKFKLAFSLSTRMIKSAAEAGHPEKAKEFIQIIERYLEMMKAN